MGKHALKESDLLPTIDEALKGMLNGKPTGSNGADPKLIAEIPLVSTVPGAQFASVESISVKAGSARGPKDPKKAIYYGRVPKKCPKGGFPIKSELTFQTGETVTVTYKAPCPKK